MTLEIFETALRLALHGHENWSVFEHKTTKRMRTTKWVRITVPLTDVEGCALMHEVVTLFGNELTVKQTMFNKLWFFDLKR